MSKKNKNKNALCKFKTNMADNIDSMDSLMTLFNCELYVIEHILLTVGHCYWYDVVTKTMRESFLTLNASEYGDIDIYLTTTDDNTTRVISPLECYVYTAKVEEELSGIEGKQ